MKQASEMIFRSQTLMSRPTYLWFYIKDTEDMCGTTCACDSPLALDGLSFDIDLPSYYCSDWL